VIGLRITPGAVAELRARLLAATVAERKAIAGIEPARADVIAAGAAIIARIIARIDAPVLITCDRGIRWGAVYEQRSTGGPGCAS